MYCCVPVCLGGYNEKTEICDKSVALPASVCHGRPGSELLCVAWEPRCLPSRQGLCVLLGGGVPFPELGCGDQPDWLEDKCMVGENGEALVRALSWVGNSCPEERGEHLSLFY